MPPKTNKDYMREIRNIQPAHPLVYERIEQILTEKDKQKEEAVAEAKERIFGEIEQLKSEKVWNSRKNKMVNKLHMIELLHKQALKASSIEDLNAIEEIQKELFRL